MRVCELYVYVCARLAHEEKINAAKQMKWNEMKFIVQIGRKDVRQNKLANKHNLWRTLKCQHTHNIHS